MNRRAREFVKWVIDNGYGDLEGHTNGGHLTIRLRNGERVTYSSTPSAWSASSNGRSEVLRLLGIGSQSPRAGKIRYKPESQTVTVTKFEGPLSSALQARAKQISHNVSEAGDPRISWIRERLLDQLAEYRDIEAELTRRGMPTPPLPQIGETA
jgi:hypothetical protein